MDTAFYNADAPGRFGRLGSVARRAVRRLQRPYYLKLRDVLTGLLRAVEGQQARAEDLTTHIRAVADYTDGRMHAIDHHANTRCNELQARGNELQAQIVELTRKLTAAEAAAATEALRLRAFAADYLAVTRRLAHLEDLLVGVLADAPADVLPLRRAA